MSQNTGALLSAFSHQVVELIKRLRFPMKSQVMLNKVDVFLARRWIGSGRSSKTSAKAAKRTRATSCMAGVGRD
jgi:hypothetical protein